jgi:prenyl protein peptidase
MAYQHSQIFVVSLAVLTLYVAPLYLLVPSSVAKLPRDHRYLILWRTVAVLVSCGLIPFSLRIFFDEDLMRNIPFGFSAESVSIKRILLPPLLMVIFFLGPIVEYVIWSALIFYHGDYSSWLHDATIRLFGNSIWISMRSLIVSPFAEEFVFRSVLLPIFLKSPVAEVFAVIIAGFIFGLAHCHHFLELRKNGMSVKSAVRRTVEQVAYTSLFGMISGKLLLQSKSYVGVALAHSFANFMGFPSFAYQQGWHPLFAFRNIINGLYALGLILFVYALSNDMSLW